MCQPANYPGIYDRAFASRITGADALAINTKVGFSDLPQKCQRMLSAYRSKKYKERFGWIDHLKIVRDPILIQKLDEKVLSTLRDDDLEKIYLAAPEIVDWRKEPSFRYSTESDGALHTELSINEYADTIHNLTTLSIQELKEKSIQVYTHDQDEPIDEWSVYRCIIFENEYRRKLYVLTDGNWYQIAKDFADEIKASLSALPLSDLDLPGVRIGEPEEDYLIRVAALREQTALKDQKLVHRSGFRDPIEICDLLTSDHQFIHVKKGNKSATLSHLFAQGMISAGEILRDRDFRMKVRERLRTLDPDLSDMIPEARPRPEDFEVVYAIITDKNENWPLSLPFFSQLHLMQAANYLHTLGYRISTIPIASE